MQTFLPYPSFRQSADVLDQRRLGKQRVEVIQIVRALTVPTYAWKSHPAVLMWQGHPEALGRYGLTMVEAWQERGFDDSCAATIVADLAAVGIGPPRSEAALLAEGAVPPWLGDERVHRSHRSALVRKDPAVYGPRFPDVPDDLPYFWPVRSPKVLEAEKRREAARAARVARAAAKTVADAEQAAKRRSRAAQKGAKTRKANAAGTRRGPAGAEARRDR